MKKKFIAASLVTSLVFAAPSFAAPVDFTDNGNYTSDTISGMDWLDVTETRNLSYNFVSSQLGLGGDYEGWRYASGIEFNQMVLNYTGTSMLTTDYSQIVHDEGLMDGLIDLLGATYEPFNDGSFRQTRGLLSDSHQPRYITFQFSARLVDDDRRQNDDYSDANGIPHVPDDRYSKTGSFLVRDTNLIATPIPAAAFMFAPALLGFLGFRRKLRA